MRADDVLLGRVLGHVVSTAKHESLVGNRLMIVRPILPDGSSAGRDVMAVDSVGAGVGERVLVVMEGRSAAEALRKRGAPVDAAIVGIVDDIEVA